MNELKNPVINTKYLKTKWFLKKYWIHDKWMDCKVLDLSAGYIRKNVSASGGISYDWVTLIHWSYGEKRPGCLIIEKETGIFEEQ